LKAPENVTELQRVLGMINYLGRYIPDLSTIVKPMTDLLKSKTAWFWGPDQESAFMKVKDMLTCAPVLAFYDKTKPIVVSADASSFGLGAALFQQEGTELKPVAYCSRTLTESEKKWAQIEKECLAGVWACEKFSRYLVGLEKFTLLTDHKPLVPLINVQDLDKTPLRCQRLLMRLRNFNAEAKFVSGKDMLVPDALSRSPLPSERIEQILFEVNSYVESVHTNRPVSDAKMDKIRQFTKSDIEIQKAIICTQSGWPEKLQSVPMEAKCYFPVRSDLSVSEGLLLFRDRIVIPSRLRGEILESIHSGHQGISKCRERAAMCVWWPSISKDIEYKVQNCNFCQTHRPTQQKEPLKTSDLPSGPWVKIAADLCEINNKQYLVVTDYYSRYVEIACLKKITSLAVIEKLKIMFSTWGDPEELVSDNGKQFISADFKSFAQERDFKQTFSSPYYSQGNGEAEAGVKIAKHILRQKDFHSALRAYRSTPSKATGFSPSQLMIGRNIRTNLPSLQASLRPKWPRRETVKKRDSEMKQNNKRFFDRRNTVRPLNNFQPGETVRMKLDSDKTWATQGIVKEAIPNARSYVVETPTGTFRRNRRHLKSVQTPVKLDTPGDLGQSNNSEEQSITPKESQPENSQPPENSQTIEPDTLKTKSGRTVRRPLRFNDYVY
ncbi:MAG: RNase H-like domain-containing protein, partial [Candidatus Thiodiazotropha endolucinida]|nr:DDE-type integrase/transposase/recombinase [Candidatus Thiodiazotropha taylori]MCW4343434.1 RNase H-like domain-containing protein [Candidatus Thiodiazotropha endolucinida]